MPLHLFLALVAADAAMAIITKDQLEQQVSGKGSEKRVGQSEGQNTEHYDDYEWRHDCSVR